jgi:hypothetical protein
MKLLARTIVEARFLARGIALAFCAAVSAFSATQLGVGSGDANLGGIASIPLNLQSDVPVAALQVDLVVSPAVASISAPLSAGALGSHFAESAQISSNAYRILIYSLFNQPLPNGPIISLEARVSSGFASGTIGLAPANAILASPGAAAVAGVGLSPGSIRVGAGSTVRLQAVTASPGGALRFEISGLTGSSFVLEQSADLSDWSLAETLPAQGGTAVVTRTIPAGAGAQFYRVRQP